MKILQLIQKKQLRGAELFACQLSTELVKKGHHVRLVVLEDGNAALPFPVAQVLGLKKGVLSDLQVLRRLHTLIRDWQPDIVQANAGDTVRLAVWSKLLFRWKAALVMRNASTISRYMNGWYRKAYYRFLVSKVDAVASVSQVSYNDFVQTFPGAVSNIHLLPVGIDPEPYSHVLPATGYGSYILHVGGFTFEKNHAGLIRIFEQVFSRFPDVQLLCAGDGPLLPAMQRLVEERHLNGRILFLGQRSDIPALMKGARMVVLPSIIEGLPSVLLEGMYCGIPVVAYDTGGIRQVVTDATGWLVPLNREDLFSETVIGLLDGKYSDESERVKAGRVMVEQFYTISKVTEGFEGVYEGLIR